MRTRLSKLSFDDCSHGQVVRLQDTQPKSLFRVEGGFATAYIENREKLWSVQLLKARGVVASIIDKTRVIAHPTHPDSRALGVSIG